MELKAHRYVEICSLIGQLRHCLHDVAILGRAAEKEQAEIAHCNLLLSNVERIVDKWYAEHTTKQEVQS